MSTKYFPYTTWGKTYNVGIIPTAYVSDNSLAIQLVEDTGIPFATATTKLPDYPPYAPNRAFLDTNNLPGIDDWFEELKLGFPTGNIGFSGYCAYPEFEFYLDRIQEIAPEL